MGMGSKQSNVSRFVITTSRAVKIELYRGHKYGNIRKILVGKHEGKVVDLLENGE